MGRKKSKLWSVTRISDPRYPDLTIRITETRPDGNLAVVRQVDGKQRMRSLRKRRTLFGATDAEQRKAVRALGLDILEALAKGGTVDDATNGGRPSTPDPGDALTLRELADLYERHGLHGRSEQYQREQPAKIRRVASFLGPERTCVSLSKSDVERFEVYRREEDGVAQGTIHGDVAALKIALNWATEHRRADGSFLLDKNPLARYRKLVSRSKNPNRYVATEERFRRLREAASGFPLAFRLALDLAWHTGHRIGAIRGLRWEDVDFETSESAPYGSITWRAEFDKTDHEHTVPMNEPARDALLAAREERPGIGAAWVFPSVEDPTRRQGHRWFRRKLLKAEKAAGLEHIDGAGWHAFRRAWATRRKHFPLKDVAAAGGWKDTAALRECYQHADAGTVLDVVNGG